MSAHIGNIYPAREKSNIPGQDFAVGEGPDSGCGVYVFPNFFHQSGTKSDVGFIGAPYANNFHIFC
jgi:hypothetical protein